jgi:pyruvate/2-oxoglutarate dehydrogenase complex dihydrolipoamide acyltransferase (E2) component
MEAHGIGRPAFAGRDLVNGADILEYLQALAPGPALAPEPTSSIPGAASSFPATAAKQAPKASGQQAALAPDPAKAILQRLTSAKRREIEYLSDVQSAGITSTIDIYVDTENIFTHINKSLKYFKDSLLPVILYESSRLLVSYPLLNAWFTGDGVAVYHEVNPGFAIDIDKGLKVLKIARAGSKTIAEIEADILQLSGSYLDETLELEALTDITFTITDLSSEGVAFFRPLVNKMNSAILGVSAIDNKLKRCVLSLTFDHRVTEGRLAARFLHELKERLESYRPVDLAEYKDITCFKCYKTLKEDLGGAGFARCITPAGKDGYICQSCLKGF